MNKRIAVLPGDGIGPEVIEQAVKLLRAVEQRFKHEFELEYADIGGIAIDNHGDSLPESTLKLCRNVNAILLGAVGGPKWSDPKAAIRPEQGLLKLRGELNLFANIRPIKNQQALIELSPLRPERLHGVDFVVVRELTGGIYFGDRVESDTDASDLCRYTATEVRRIARVAAGLAKHRKGRLVSVDKANVLATSRLWRTVVSDVVLNEFPEVRLEHLLVDAAAMHLIQKPSSFDVIVTENLFGDILTDEASVLSGSIGLLPSASLNEGGLGLYEPIHGSAPAIAGQGIANPYGTLASVAMMLRHSLGMSLEATRVEAAINQCIEEAILSVDLCDSDAASSTDEIGDAVCAAL